MDFKELGAMFGGGISGIGQGMMSNKFRQSYNAGQGGMNDIYQGVRARDFVKGRLQRPKTVELKKEAGELFGSPDVITALKGQTF